MPWSAVMTMIGISRVVDRSRRVRHTANPSMVGIRSSSTTRTSSGCVIGGAVSQTCVGAGPPQPETAPAPDDPTRSGSLGARGRHAERSVAGPARVTTEVLHDVLGRLRVLRLGGVPQLHSLRLELLGRRLELRPLLPDL